MLFWRRSRLLKVSLVGFCRRFLTIRPHMPRSLPPAEHAPASLNLFLLLLLLTGGMTGCTNFYGKGILYQIEHRYSVSDPQFLRSMGSLLEPGILASNKVTTLLNGDQLFPAMLESVRGAEKSICLETYIYWSGDVGREFADALAEKARAGVKVHIIIDW